MDMDVCEFCASSPIDSVVEADNMNICAQQYSLMDVQKRWDMDDGKLIAISQDAMPKYGGK